MQNNTILIVDDTVTNLDILSDLLCDYDILVATNGADALEMCEEEDITLILLDIMMPDMSGFEVCERLKSQERTKDIPIIFITAKSDEDSIEKAYDIGGIDYVQKPFKPKELLAKVKREFELQKLKNELIKLASIDPMTGLYNRRHFKNVSSHHFSLAQRNSSEISVIILDIDKFKTINDTYGHKVGDDVIISLAELLKSRQRKSDIISRFGGEEFVVLLPFTKLEDATNLAEKIRETVQEQKVKIDDEIEIQFTVSIGVSNVDIKNEINVEKSLIRADEALYEAKQNGRNKVCIKDI
jgi:diguanylate cyclase (GGDEF)-like protein